MGMKNLRALDQGFKGTWDDPTIKKRFLYMLSDSGLNTPKNIWLKDLPVENPCFIIILQISLLVDTSLFFE